MITEPTASVVPAEITGQIETLHGQVSTLERELRQALDVWQTTLADEKKKFEDLLTHKSLAWQEQDGQWAKQSQVYEERFAEMKSEFESRLRQTDQAAARALAELDDAWQRDKLEWGPVAKAEWPAQRREFESKVQSLEERLSELEHAATTERSALQARIQELENQSIPVAPSSPTPETVIALEAQLLHFQQAVATLQDRTSQSDELVMACVHALDYQVSVLYDLVHHFSPPASGASGPIELVEG